MQQVFISRLNIGFRFSSYLSVEVAHSQSSEESTWIEALFARLEHKPSLFKGLGHNDVRVLDDVTLPLLDKHKIFEGKEGRMLRPRG